jgi:hypothetical protein
MKRCLMAIGMAALVGGCASQEQPEPRASAARLGAGDELGWQLQSRDQAITSANAEERDLASHE